MSVRGRELAASSNSVMKHTTYWCMKKQIAKVNNDKTMQLMVNHDFVLWTDNYVHTLGHVIPTAEKGSWTCASFSGTVSHEPL